MIFLPGAWQTGRQWLSPVALGFRKRMIFLLERRRAGWQWLSPVALGFGKVNFLSTNVPAFLSCMTLNLWMALPFMIMMIDGALSSIDRSYYESAELDGAGFWSKNIHITVPAMKGSV